MLALQIRLLPEPLLPGWSRSILSSREARMSGGIGRKPPTVSPAKPFNPFSAKYAAEHEHGCVPRVPERPHVWVSADEHQEPLPVARVPAPWWRRLWASLTCRSLGPR